MGYESYEPYEPYEPSEPYEQSGQYERYEQQGEQYRPEHYGQDHYGQDHYGQQHGQAQYDDRYADPYPADPYAADSYVAEQSPYPQQHYGENYEGQDQSQQQYQDAQWAQSGLGWERAAWDEARLGVSPLQELDESRRGRTQTYEQPHEPTYEERAYESYEQYGQQYDSYAPYERPTGGRAHDDGVPEPPVEPPAPAPEPSASVPRQDAEGKPDKPVPGATASAPGRWAFGAAGIGVVTAVAALASSGALLVVVALIQAGVGYGWQQAMTPRANGRADRRAAVLTALIGWAASAVAYRLSSNDDVLALPATLGVGFLLLAADQTWRARPLGEGERVTGLAVAVAGGLFAALPSGFLVAEHSDTALTAACALAAALGVLCCALIGRDPLRGILAGLVLGAGVGAVAAKSLAATGGLEAGALGGAVAALGAAAAVGALDRIVAEGGARGSARIVSQVLPPALAAVGALLASAVFR